MDMQPMMSWRERYMRLPMGPEDATWLCDACGEVQPRRLTMFGQVRYARTSCACEEAMRVLQAHEEQERMWRAAAARRTYSWLGRQWSDLPLLEKTFENFDATHQPNAVTDALDFCELFSGSLVLFGGYGTGKTHLLASVCQRMLATRNVCSLFVTAPKLFASIAACIQQHEGFAHIIQQAVNAPLLIVDDIDKAKTSTFREETYFEILDERVKNGRPTAISTNRLDELDLFVGGAVCSRLKIGQIASEMIGVDYREAIV